MFHNHGQPWLPSQWGFNTIAVGQRVGSNAPADGAGDLNGFPGFFGNGDVMGNIHKYLYGMVL